MRLNELFEQVKWVVGNLASNGLLLKSQGISIHCDRDDAEALIAALKASDTVVIKTTDNKRFSFTPVQGGVEVREVGVDAEDAEGVMLSLDDVNQIIITANSQQ